MPSRLVQPLPVDDASVQEFEQLNLQVEEQNTATTANEISKSGRKEWRTNHVIAKPPKPSKKVKAALKANKAIESASVEEPTITESVEQDTPLASENQVFTCKHCSKSFATQTKLGGHASKVHVGQSEAYNLKMEKRKSREVERFALQIAQKLLLDMTNLSKEQRIKVQTQVKTEVMKLREGQLPTDFSVENLKPVWIERLYADLVNPELTSSLKFRKMLGCNSVFIPQPQQSF